MPDEPMILKRPKRTSRANQQLSLLIFALVVIACIALAAYYLLTPDKETFVLKTFRFAEVTERPFWQLVTTEGTVTPRTVRTLTAPASGVTAELQVSAGQDVPEGAILCVIDSPTLHAKLEQTSKDLQEARVQAKKIDLDSQVKIRELEAELQAAENDVDEAERVLEVWEKLFELGDISRSELDKYRRSAEDAKRRYESLSLTYEATKEKYEFDIDNSRYKVADLEQQLRDLEKDAESLVVKSTIAGRVLEVKVSEGGSVQEGSTMFTVADLSTSYVSAEISMSALSSVRIGQPVTVTMMGEQHRGSVSYLAPQATANATTVGLEVAFEALPQTLIPNAACLLDIEVSKKEAANSLPRDHYLSSGGSMYLYVLDDEMKTATKAPARFGLIEGGYVEVLSGADKGDRVIVSSYDEFIDKDEITVSEKGGTPI